MIDAVVFDMDGVLIQSEEVWDEVREAYVRERGGRYDDAVQRAMMGMSSREWSAYLHVEAGVPDEPEEINAEVVRRMLAGYRDHLPLIPGAVDAARRLADAFTLGLASSSNRELIDAVLDVAGLAPLFCATVSSGRARQACARRLPRSGAAARRRPGAMRGDRGLARRHPLGEGGGNARDRDPEPDVSARRRGARARRPHASVATGSDIRCRRRRVAAARSTRRSPRGRACG